MSYEKLTAIVCIIIVLVLISGIIYSIRKRRFERTVVETSYMLKSLAELNASYQFWNDIEKTYQYVKQFETKPKYDRCDETLIDEFIWQDSERLVSVAEKCEENEENYQEYLKQVGEITSTITEREAIEMKTSIEKYQKVERKLFEREIYKAPTTTATITAVAKYRSPQGRNSYMKNWTLSISEVSQRYYELLEEEEKKQSVEFLRRRERSKMTPKLRYSILQRDGFRCKICGRGEKDGVKLHVDHIVPVSKGGKTEESNLRVLCEDCNIGKGARLEMAVAITDTK